MAEQELIERPAPRQNSARDFVRILFRHKWKMVVFFVACFGTVLVMTALAPYYYRSEAKVMVRLGRESVTVDPTATTVGPIVPVSRTREAEIQAELQILNSQAVLRKVVDAVGSQGFEAAGAQSRHPVRAWLEQFRPTGWGSAVTVDPKEQAVNHLAKTLTIERSGGRESNVIALRYQAPDPRFAQQVLAQAIQAYLDEHLVVHRTTGSYQFFSEQYQMSKKRLEGLQAQLDDLKKQLGVLSLEEQIRVALARADRIRSEIVTTEAGISASSARIAKLQAALEKLPETVVTAKTTGTPNPPADAVKTRLADLRLMLEDLASKYDDNSRPIQDLRRQILKAEELAGQEETTRTSVTESLNASRVTLEGMLITEQATLAALQAQVEVLKKDLEQANTDLRTLNDVGGKIRDLTREIEIEEAKYRRYADSLEQARVDQAMQDERISNISVIQPATLPILPAGPNKPLLAALGLVLAILGSITIAMVAEHADHTIKTPDDVTDHLGLPTLASVPLTRRSTIAPAASGRGLFGLLKRSQQEAEVKWSLPRMIRTQYELLREAVVFASQGTNGSEQKVQVQDEAAQTGLDAVLPAGDRKARRLTRPRNRLVGLVGSRRGEGVTVVAGNLAALLAERGKVLLIDANVKDPASHKIFGIRVSFGLLDVLAGGKEWQKAIWKTPVPNLDLMPVGTAQTEEVDIQQFLRIIKLAGKHYDYIVLDLPPVNEAGYTIRLAGLCDHVGLIVEAERSRWEVVQKTTEYLDRVQAKVLGVVLNKRRYHIPGWLYNAL
ncbi:MAG: cellulose synthase operon protein YhjQ/BcsQ [Sedimentisphaerales bacterium]|nr:cellulose synthase operon protein YhjQ/BcsQ [Sedimentisphaerales bacterium]